MISRLYAKVIRNNFSLNAFEMITELLQRHSEIFRKNSHNASAVQEEM